MSGICRERMGRLLRPFSRRTDAGTGPSATAPGAAAGRPGRQRFAHRSRSLTLESLEPRQLLSGDIVAINEIHYDPEIKTEPVEYVELVNTGDTAVDLSGWSLAGGIAYTIPAGTYLPAGGFLVVAQDPAAVRAKFGIESLGPVAGRLNNDGEDLELRDAAGVQQDLVDYRLGFPWPTVGDAPGHSIQLIDPDLDNELGGSWRSAVPSPGLRNAVFAENAAPQLRQVEHLPAQPRSNQDVTVTVKVTDPDGVDRVALAYQLVDPGDYIAIDDPRYATNWTSLVMRDDGARGDEAAGDDTFTAVLPASLQTHRRLVRYRITATDSRGASITGPYPDDPQPNFAYFVYDGVPPWTGSAQPGVAPEVTYGSELLESVAVYQLITTRKDHEDSQFIPNSTRESGYEGSDYLWNGALVYDGHVYDHIRYRARGGVWRYAMGKNMWKFDFNRGHDFQARDDYGNIIGTKRDRLIFSAIIQLMDKRHRGEQGLFESVTYRLFNLAGVPAPTTNYVHFRIVENADPNASDTDQFSTDFQGLYLAIENPDGRMLEEHGLPDGNFYKIEGYNGDLKNQGPTQPSDGSDLDAFKNGFNGSPTEEWWRENFELEQYYSYRSVVEAIHHYDIAYGKNYFYYHNPETGRWSIHPWDVDQVWAKTMYGNGNHAFKTLIADRAEFRTEYRNRLREFRDLLYNPDQTGMLIDEIASFVYREGKQSFVDADRAMWDYNPILESRDYVDMTKARNGRFYEYAATHDFAGMIQIMKNYIVTRGAWIDSTILDDEDLVAKTPTITYSGADSYPINGLAFTTNAYASDTAPFAAMEWRIGEVTDTDHTDFDPGKPRKYEIESVWESGEITTFDPTISVVSDDIRAGKTYRARVRMQDTNGRWSHWSDPVQFVAGPPTGPLAENLRITEVNYNPYGALTEHGDLAVDNDLFEFVELRNIGDEPIHLLGARFDEGIDFTFGNVHLAAGEHVLIVRDRDAFESRYGTQWKIAGQFVGSALANEGEMIRLRDADGNMIVEFTYDDQGDWPANADGAGASIECLDTAGDDDDPAHWRSSVQFGGSPGRASAAPEYDVVVNEVLSRGDNDDPDQIELLNTAAHPVDVSGWYVSDDPDDLLQARLPAGTTIGAGATVVLGPAEFGFGLSGKRGDSLWLIEADDHGRPVRFADHVEFDASDQGVSLGRWPNGDPEAILFPMIDSSFGAANPGHATGEVLVSEVHYHPDPAPDLVADFETGTAAEFAPVLGTWVVHDGAYTVTPGAEGDTIAVIPTDGPMPAAFVVSANVTISTVPGHKDNGVILFDYHGPMDFKFVSMHASGDVWRIGKRDASGWQFLESVSAPIDVDNDIGVRIEIDGSMVVVSIQGQTAVYDYGSDLSDGLVGVGSRDGTPRFEKVKVKQIGDPQDREFLELTATGIATVDLAGWRLTDGVEWTFPAGTTLAPGEAMVVVGFDPLDAIQLDAFREVFAIDQSVTIIGPYQGRLSNGGEVVRLLKPVSPGAENSGFVLVDQVGYDDRSPWPTEADGNGTSLQRKSAASFGNLAASWYRLAPSPGVVRYVVAGDMDLDGDFDTDDVHGFVLALADAIVYEARYGVPAVAVGDMDGDGDVDFDDIGGFVARVRATVPAVALSSEGAADTASLAASCHTVAAPTAGAGTIPAAVATRPRSEHAAPAGLADIVAGALRRAVRRPVPDSGQVARPRPIFRLTEAYRQTRGFPVIGPLPFACCASRAWRPDLHETG